MRLVRAEAWAVSMPLAEPYTIAQASYDRADNVFLRLVPDKGAPGYGCAAPDPEITGETAADALAALAAVEPLLAGADPLARNRVLARVKPALDALLRTDLDLKSSAGDERVLVERLIVELSGRDRT